jgi:hypothetical protein
MRSVLVAAAASALLATPAAGQDWKGKGLETVTICEVQGVAKNNGTSIDNGFHVFHAGLDADITVPSDFEEMTLCEAFGRKEAASLCKKNNRRGRRVDGADVLFSFKRAVEDPFPPDTGCTGPTDPHCLDTSTQAFKFDSIAATLVSFPCDG